MNVGSMKALSLVCLTCCAAIASSPGANSAEPIKVGAVLPFSGGVELYGRQAKLGLDLAAKDINAAGGILGRPVELLYADDKTDPAVATDATRKLIERDGVLAVVGPITSRNLDAMAPVVESLKTPLLYATNYEGGKCSRYVFSFSTVPNQELAQLLPYMNRDLRQHLFPARRRPDLAAQDVRGGGADHHEARRQSRRQGVHQGRRNRFRPADRADRGDESKGPAVRAQRRRPGFHPAGG